MIDCEKGLNIYCLFCHHSHRSCVESRVRVMLAVESFHCFNGDSAVSRTNEVSSQIQRTESRRRRNKEDLLMEQYSASQLIDCINKEIILV